MRKLNNKKSIVWWEDNRIDGGIRKIDFDRECELFGFGRALYDTSWRKMSRTATVTSKSALLSLYCDTDGLRVGNEAKETMKPSYWNTRSTQLKSDRRESPTKGIASETVTTPVLGDDERAPRLPLKSEINGTTPAVSYTLRPATDAANVGGTIDRQTAYLILSPLNSTFERKVIPLPSSPASIRIGRVTNSRTVPNPSNAYFDSKVLSRQHAELFCDGASGRAFIKDIRSSNGTFLNGTRLSQENVESAPHEIHNNDILELGIDILTDDNKTVLHQKVAARVEHAGFLPRVSSPPLSGGASRELDLSADKGLDAALRSTTASTQQPERLLRMTAADLDPRNSLTCMSGGQPASVEANHQHKFEVLFRRLFTDLHTAKASGIELALLTKKLRNASTGT